MINKKILGALTLSLATWATVADAKEFLVKLAPSSVNDTKVIEQIANLGGKTQVLANNWVKVTSTNDSLSIQSIEKNVKGVEYVQPNYRIKLIEDYRAKNDALIKALAMMEEPDKKKDNPSIPALPSPTQGEDPLYNKQWGMIDNQVKEAWKHAFPSPFMSPPPMIVAVIDTGVDYTHEDLLPNMWRNPGEVGKDDQGRDKSINGVDDDQNGFTDDIVGWDFVSKDNKPYDLSMSGLELLMGGGNPGHGTHCAGSIAAATNNGKGIIGIAPNVKIMALRFLSEKGSGTTADAILAIAYAVNNGATITSNSWGSEGEDPNEGKENKALRDMVQYAQDKGTLFIAAAGNGHSGVGYDNDTDSKPGYPASYDHENIISVAAIDNNDQLGPFSNWGQRSVDIGAPGVKTFSTVPGNKYSDTVIDTMGITAYWDGTSMAAPHVSGAAALYWTAHPELKWRQVKEAILSNAKSISALEGKTSSGGKLDILKLMQQ